MDVRVESYIKESLGYVDSAFSPRCRDCSFSKLGDDLEILCGIASDAFEYVGLDLGCMEVDGDGFCKKFEPK